MTSSLTRNIVVAAQYHRSGCCSHHQRGIADGCTPWTVIVLGLAGQIDWGEKEKGKIRLINYIVFLGELIEEGNILFAVEDRRKCTMTTDGERNEGSDDKQTRRGIGTKLMMELN